jgi:hypothetical protein
LRVKSFNASVLAIASKPWNLQNARMNKYENWTPETWMAEWRKVKNDSRWSDNNSLVSLSRFYFYMLGINGGSEIWNVVKCGDAIECHSIDAVIEDVREALEAGCRTVRIERQGKPE